MKQAKFISKLDAWKGDARVYEVDPPVVIPDDDWKEELRGKKFRHVIVSSADVHRSGQETYIFPAKRTGDTFDVADWGELEGSFKGSLDHEKALLGAGYRVRDQLLKVVRDPEKAA
jgi:hypothetical protein